jgi:hypothetical protein
LDEDAGAIVEQAASDRETDPGTAADAGHERVSTFETQPRALI